MKRMTELVEKIIFVLAFVGFCYQVVQVSKEYFAFKVMYRVKSVMSREVRAVNINICVPYIETLIPEILQKDTGSLASDNLTISQILMYTPSPEDVISSCRFRDRNIRMIAASRDQCYDRYTVNKNYVQSYVCYHVMEKTTTPLVMELITHGIDEPLVIGSIVLSEVFNNVTTIHAVPSGGPLPALISRDYVDIVTLSRKDNTGTILLISPSWFSTQELPFPYASRCIPRGNSLLASPYYRLTSACIRQRVGMMNRVPVTEYISDPINMTHVTDEDMRSETFAASIRKVYGDCYTEHSHEVNYCRLAYSTARTRVVKTSKPGIAITMQTQRSPDTLSQAVAVVQFIEYFSFVCSCFGTWFGASFMSISCSSCLKKGNLVKKPTITVSTYPSQRRKNPFQDSYKRSYGRSYW